MLESLAGCHTRILFAVSSKIGGLEFWQLSLLFLWKRLGSMLCLQPFFFIYFSCRSAACEATRIQSFLYKISSISLLVVNWTYTKILKRFIILCPKDHTSVKNFEHFSYILFVTFSVSLDILYAVSMRLYKMWSPSQQILKIWVLDSDHLFSRTDMTECFWKIVYFRSIELSWNHKV